jgi:hypothetical protein
MLISGKEYIIMFMLLCPTAAWGWLSLVSKIFNDNLKLIGSRIGFLGFLDTAGSMSAHSSRDSYWSGFGYIKSFLFTAYLML